MAVRKQKRYKSKKDKKKSRKGKNKSRKGKNIKRVGKLNKKTRISKARKKIKGGFVEIPGYLIPFMYGGSFISVYFFMLSMLANNPDVAKKIRAKSKVINNSMTNQEIADKKEKEEKVVLKKILKLVTCDDNKKKYIDLVKLKFESQSDDDKNKFVERYNNLFEDMNIKDDTDEQKKNFVEWNEKMNEFFKMLCKEDNNEINQLKALKDELKTLTDKITSIIFLGGFYNDLFDDLYRVCISSIKDKHQSLSNDE